MSDKTILSKLFLAIPELRIDQALLDALLKNGLVTQAEIDAGYKARQRSAKYAEMASRMRGATLIQRLMLLAPEIISVGTIDLLRRYELIPAELGNALRLGLRGAKLLNPRVLQDKTVAERWAALGSTVFNAETINLLQDLDKIAIARLASRLPDTPENQDAMRQLLRQNIDRSQALRSVVSTGRIAAKTAALAAKQDTLWGVLTIVGEGILSERVLRDAIRAGVISQSRYELLRSIELLGLNVWRKVGKAFEYDSFAARAALVSEGILSPEMIKVLENAKFITPELAKMLYPAATAVRVITRGALQKHQAGIRARIVPGEAPIKSFARVSQLTDSQILKLLAEAAEDARKTALDLATKKGIGSLSRAAQLRIIEDTLHKEMRNLWEGLGYLTIFGEKEAARAALEGMDLLQGSLWRRVGSDGDLVRRSLMASARSGIDSYISREENVLALSRRVYKNYALSSGLVERTVQKGLLRGLSARELSQEVADLIRPSVRGGVNYAAMRLARTEINNAFHITSQRYTRDQPWVDGYQWHLSGSHPHIDICNELAQANPDSLGRGCYKVYNVPPKPHPHCFCYITTITKSPGEFEKQLRRGSYDAFLAKTNAEGPFPETNRFQKVANGQLKQVAQSAGSALVARAVTTIGTAAAAALIRNAPAIINATRSRYIALRQADLRGVLLRKTSGAVQKIGFKKKSAALPDLGLVEAGALGSNLYGLKNVTALGKPLSDFVIDQEYGEHADWSPDDPMSAKLAQAYQVHGSEYNALLRGRSTQDGISSLGARLTNKYRAPDSEWMMDFGPVTTSKRFSAGTFGDVVSDFDKQFVPLEKDMTVFRVTNRRDGMDPGAKLFDQGYTSASTTDYYYEGASPTSESLNSRVKMFLPKGTPVFRLEGDEIVIGRGATYQIGKVGPVKQRGDGGSIIPYDHEMEFFFTGISKDARKLSGGGLSLESWDYEE